MYFHVVLNVGMPSIEAADRNVQRFYVPESIAVALRASIVKNFTEFERMNFTKNSNTDRIFTTVAVCYFAKFLLLFSFF